MTNCPFPNGQGSRRLGGVRIAVTRYPLGWKERSEPMGKLGKEAKGAINKAAKSKGSGGGTKGKKSSGKGADKAKRGAREILK